MKFSNKEGDNTEIWKHEEIEKGSYKANKFFFVVPDGLVKVEEVPENCGLIYYDAKGFQKFKVVKNAKIIHRIKFDESGFKDLCKSLSWREIAVRLKNVRQKKQIEQLKKNL